MTKEDTRFDGLNKYAVLREVKMRDKKRHLRPLHLSDSVVILVPAKKCTKKYKKYKKYKIRQLKIQND